MQFDALLTSLFAHLRNTQRRRTPSPWLSPWRRMANRWAAVAREQQRQRLFGPIKRLLDGRSQTTVARAAGLSKSLVCAGLRGRARLSPSILDRLATAVSLDASALAAFLAEQRVAYQTQTQRPGDLPRPGPRPRLIYSAGIGSRDRKPKPKPKPQPRVTRLRMSPMQRAWARLGSVSVKAEAAVEGPEAGQQSQQGQPSSQASQDLAVC